MTNPSPDNKMIARHVARVFGGTPRVVRCWDEPNEYSVDVVTCLDSPVTGVTAYSTLTLSNSPLIVNGREFHIRLELAGACDSNVTEFANVLATAAFYIMKDKWSCRPGVVFESMLSMYQLSTSMEHLYFTAPSQWPELNTTLELATKKVTWLWAIPISEVESRYIAKHGDDQFESLLEQSDVNVFDLHRPSIL